MNIISPLQSLQLFGKPSTQPATTVAGEKPSLDTLLPNPGQLLKAVVLEARTDNRFLLQIGDNQLLAKSDVPLRPGQALQLQLLSTTPQLELKIVSDTLNQFLGRSLTLVGNTIDISTLFQSLQQPASIFNSLSLHTQQALNNFFSLQKNDLSGGDGGTVLKQLVDKLGLSLENILSRGENAKAASSLKAALLEVMHNFQNKGNIGENAGRLLGTLEFFQLAQLHADTTQQLIFPLPLSFLEQGFLLIERRQDEDSDKKGYDEQEYRFSLHLKLTDIGNITVDFLHNQEGLFIRFHTDSQEKADFIATFSDELKEAISDTPILGISFAADAEDPATELIRHIIPEGKSVLDTTA
jgi:hypothetical protein